MKQYRVGPGDKVRLKNFDPADTSDLDEEQCQAAVEKFQKRLTALQELLYAGHRWKILIILQGMDTSGKDGTISHVISALNPAGVRVESYKKPSEEELDHDFLWRIHDKVPAKGEVTIFNRSQYEDVLVVRVHELVPAKVWRKRFRQITDFERMLSKNDTVILKFFLHISKDEQRKRLLERIENPEKHWKFQKGDIEERKLWVKYMDAYQDAVEKTSTEFAPWYIVPSDAKWYRNYVIGSVIVDALEKLNMKFPKIDLSDVKIV